jgi:hypothetical protein
MNLFLRRCATATLVLTLTASIPALAENASGSLSSLFSSLKSSVASTGDSTLKSLGSDLQSKSTALNKSLAGNSDAQSSLQSALQSLVSGKSADSLGGLQKLTAAKLTPEQTKLATDVFHTGSAFVIQKNFGALEGSQSDVAKAVTALRKGDAISALPAIQGISQNAKLTAPQKELIHSVAAKYAPGTEKIENAIKGLGNLPGFGK